ncbi:MAG: serine/threonine protein kinase [Anaerolineales bacterium]|nr:serine/threonine protein kinase [Anaerolineales bacterium]MCB0006998.1 serine/threonine protein kinase [Anaerolineales bacterium]MCB0016882.1 serine/threonine protein kinase [Anaerolineales bacterium]
MSNQFASIGPFRVRRTIHTTRASTTYLALDKQDNRVTAVTMLHLDIRQRPHAYHQFSRAAREIQKLQHPAILPILEYGDAVGHPYVAFPYCAGHTVRDQIENRPLTLSETVNLLQALVPALDMAHRLRLFHRDISPQHIGCPPDGRILWRNFGMATLFACFHSRQAAIPYGTAANMAPEMIQGGQPTALTEVYQLGITTYQMLTGRLPFTGPDHELLRCHLELTPTPPGKYVHTLDPAVDQILGRALAKKPEDRFPTAGRFLDALTSIL